MKKTSNKLKVVSLVFTLAVSAILLSSPGVSKANSQPWYNPNWDWAWTNGWSNYNSPTYYPNNGSLNGSNYSFWASVNGWPNNSYTQYPSYPSYPSYNGMNPSYGNNNYWGSYPYWAKVNGW